MGYLPNFRILGMTIIAMLTWALAVALMLHGFKHTVDPFTLWGPLEFLYGLLVFRAHTKMLDAI